MIICVDGDGTRIQLKGRLLESEQKIGKETVARGKLPRKMKSNRVSPRNAFDMNNPASTRRTPSVLKPIRFTAPSMPAGHGSSCVTGPLAGVWSFIEISGPERHVNDQHERRLVVSALSSRSSWAGGSATWAACWASPLKWCRKW